MSAGRRTPPRSAANTLPELSARTEGQPKTCIECGETKLRSRSNFAPKKHTQDGWKEICRTCEGRKAAEKKRRIDAGQEISDADRERLEREARDAEAAKRDGFERIKDELGLKPSDFEDAERLVQVASPLMVELIDLHASKSNMPRMEDLKAFLGRITRMKEGDEFPGIHTDQEKCFWVFVRVVIRPMLLGWVEPGEIHWKDIVPTLISGDRNTLLVCSRGSAKSTFTTFFVTWRLWRNPSTETILAISRAESHAKSILRAVRGYLSNPLLEDIAPSEESLDSASRLETRQAHGKLGMSASFVSKGLTSQLPGLRAKIILLDDIESDKDDRPEDIDQLEERLGEAHHILVPGDDSRIICLATPQSEISLYGRMAASSVWDVKTARLFDEDVIGKEKVFHSRWPDRFSAEEIARRHKSMTQRQWRLHWECDLSAAAMDERPIRLEHLPVVGIHPLASSVPIRLGIGEPPRALKGDLPRGHATEDDDWIEAQVLTKDRRPYIQTIMAVDPAGGLKGKGDAVGVAVLSSTASGQVIIRCVRGVRTSSVHETIREAAKIAHEHNANQVLVEENGNGLFASQLGRALNARGFPLVPEQVKAGNQRKGRKIIGALVPAFASRKVFLCLNALSGDDGKEFVTQLTGATEDGRKLKHDDIVDALAIAMIRFGPSLSGDTDEQAASARFSFEELSRMPLRMCAIPQEDLEAWCEADENQQAIQWQLEEVRRVYNDERARGIDDPSLKRRIEHLESELAKYQTGFHRPGLYADRFDRFAEGAGIARHDQYHDY